MLVSRNVPTAYGIDFGTSNSAISIYADGSPQALPIGSFGGATVPSILYFPPGSQKFTIGDDAIAAYVADGMRGRLLQSIKSLLTMPDTQYGALGKELISGFLTELKCRADNFTCGNVRTAVVGRPVMFSEDPEEDKKAEATLRAAVLNAGFEECTFLAEPIAAARSFRFDIRKPQIVMIADLGGGTSDFTLARFHPKSRKKKDSPEVEILGTSGVYTAGDEIDSGVMRRRLGELFGAGSTFDWYGQQLPFPQYLVQMLGTWYLKPKLLRERVFSMPLTEFLQEVRTRSDNRSAMENFLLMLENNLSYALFTAIEEAKKGLSTRKKETIFFEEGGVRVDEPVSRKEFEGFIAPEINKIWNCGTQLLDETGLVAHEIDHVILTGGTSFMPCIFERFANHFGQEKVARQNAFLSVVEGLAMATQRDLPIQL